MSDIKYQVATHNDAKSISLLILQSQKEFCFQEYTEDGKRLMLHLCGTDAIHSYLERGDVYYVAENNSTLVGVAGVRDNEHLSHNFVDRAWHRRGISNQLWELARNECIRRGNEGSFNLNASTYAIPVYQRWGFEIMGSTRHEHGLSFTPMELKSE